MAMKNYMGVIGGNRSAWHQNMEACLADITGFMQPKITVLDAVRVLTDHGPQGGDPQDVELRGIVAAGTDIVALDALGATLMGLDPQRITGTGRDGRITKADVLTFLRSRPAEPEPAATPRAEPPRITPGLPQVDEDRPQKRVPMSRLRARIEK